MSPSLIFTPNIYVKVCCNVSYIIKVVFFVHVYRVLHHYLSLHVVQKNLRFECMFTYCIILFSSSSCRPPPYRSLRYLVPFQIWPILLQLKENIMSNNKWHIVQTSPRYIYVLIWKTPNILRAAYFSDTFLFGKTRTKPFTHISTSAVIKIKIYMFMHIKNYLHLINIPYYLDFEFS